MCFDKNFIFGAGTLIVSILENNPDIYFYFHICVPDSEKSIVSTSLAKLGDIYDSKHFALAFYSFEQFKGYDLIVKRVNKRMATQCVRLFLDQISNYHNDTVLYIDADIVCRKSFSGVFDISFSDDTIIAASSSPDFNIDVYGHNVESYFWSSLMLINLPQWRKNNVEKKSVEFVIKHKPKYPDQDALNVVLDKKWVPLVNDCQSFWKVTPESIFVHYVASKPWSPWIFGTKLEEINLFRKYAKIFEPNVAKWISFKKDKQVLINFSTYSARFATKWMAKLMFKRHCYKAAIYFYLQHLRVKIKQKGLLGIILLRSNTRS